uniref:Uncharacterized protein n=1 Tax=Timema cristinae TaxID=61476 RepID=A0A7R9GXB9_TIMCR|nr:unnamed protein product [Timema cristinae]
MKEKGDPTSTPRHCNVAKHLQPRPRRQCCNTSDKSSPSPGLEQICRTSDNSSQPIRVATLLTTLKTGIEQINELERKSCIFTVQMKSAKTPELRLFTCLMDTIALAEGLFSENVDSSRLQLAKNILMHGFELPDGSSFGYSALTGPTVRGNDTTNVQGNVKQNRKN